MLCIKSCIKCYTNIVFFHKGTEHDTMSDGFTKIAVLKKAAFFFFDRKEWDEIKRKRTSMDKSNFERNQEQPSILLNLFQRAHS